MREWKDEITKQKTKLQGSPKQNKLEHQTTIPNKKNPWQYEDPKIKFHLKLWWHQDQITTTKDNTLTWF